MTLGDIIKKYREENSATMEQVAKLCDITKGYVAMLERNINSKTGKPVKPTIETILKVCDGLRLDINEVFSLLDDDYMISLPVKQNLPLSQDEEDLLSLYRSLDASGKKLVIDYTDTLCASKKYEISTSTFVKDNTIQYNAIAAHERTDIEVTDEMRAADDEIMEDDDF